MIKLEIEGFSSFIADPRAGGGHYVSDPPVPTGWRKGVTEVYSDGVYTPFVVDCEDVRTVRTVLSALTATVERITVYGYRDGEIIANAVITAFAAYGFVCPREGGYHGTPVLRHKG